MGCGCGVHRWASRLASSRSSAKAASIDVAESEGGGIPGLEVAGGPFRGIDQLRVTEAGYERFGSRQRVQHQDTPRDALSRVAPRDGLPESRQGTRRTRVAAGRSWLLDARAAQGSALVLEVAPLLRGP